MTALFARRAAEVEGEFALFLVGSRFHKPWRIRRCYRMFRLYRRVLAELRSTDCGYLGGEIWVARTVIHVQYWRSIEQLQAFASDPGGSHSVAWRDFNVHLAQSDAVGIWHEAYRIEADAHQSVYLNMPEFGLAKAAASKRTDSAPKETPAPATGENKA